ncbi:hypothetical protein LTS08_008669 [Lithohypha guttulata]|nr:hypothetical protein LTS08_008669 [Lithohypha guttulata]
MAQSPAGTDASHESENEDQVEGQAKNSSSKDKDCPYCHQKFTSSSLGRHLDQFLSKKKPDGIHNVDEIKKLRAGITRRTARGKKGEHNENHDAEKSVEPSPSANPQQPTYQESVNKGIPNANDLRFNRMGWQSTGVITDQNHQAASPLLAQSNNSLAGQKRSFSAYAADVPASSAETARAMELALREVLDAVNVATKRTDPCPEPFPFDLTSMTFSALCLALLPAPATLYQPTTFATNATIPLKPPGFEQLQTLRQKIQTVLDQWKWDALAYLQRSCVQKGLNVGEEAARLTEDTKERITDAMRHLDNAFQYFMSHSPEQQYQLWSIELLRAYTTEQIKLKEANERIARITQEAGQLQQQIDYLSRCQWPREMALWPPERNTFSSAVQKELQDGKSLFTSLDTVNAYGSTKSVDFMVTPEDRWDFDKLVNKWRRHIREDRARRGGTGSMLPPLPDNLETSRTGTPPASLRKALSEAGHNGQKPHSISNSPISRNGAHPVSSLGLTTVDAMPFANAQRPFAGTPSESRTHTPTRLFSNHPMPSNVHIISDVDDHMARFASWEQRQRELEARDNSDPG